MEYPGLAPGIDRTPRRRTLKCHACERRIRIQFCRSVFDPNNWGPCDSPPGWTLVLGGGKKAGGPRVNYYLCPPCGGR